MGADQTAAIRPALREIFDAVEREEEDAEGLCFTFRVPKCSNVWVQVTHDSVNAAYPRSGDPMEFLRDSGLPLVSDLKLNSWKPDVYATWSFSSCSVAALAEFIDQLFVALHALPPEDYEIDVECEHL